MNVMAGRLEIGRDERKDSRVPLVDDDLSSPPLDPDPSSDGVSDRPPPPLNPHSRTRAERQRREVCVREGWMDGWRAGEAQHVGRVQPGLLSSEERGRDGRGRGAGWEVCETGRKTREAGWIDGRREEGWNGWMADGLL